MFGNSVELWISHFEGWKKRNLSALQPLNLLLNWRDPSGDTQDSTKRNTYCTARLLS